MIGWTKTGDEVKKIIEGREYIIRKTRTMYVAYCDGEPISNPILYIADALAIVNAHAAGPAPAKQGVHIDNIAGQQLVDILKRSFTTAQIQEFIDASPFDEPDTGAPEGRS